MAGKPKVGVLAMQGAYAKHGVKLDALGIEWCEVRTAAELQDCSGLILPGGESTTITKLLHRSDLWEELLQFAEQHAILGTCAGAILMARSVQDSAQQTLDLMDYSVERNAYGRQLHSCETHVEIAGGHAEPGFFIRAPRIVRPGPNIEILATWNGDPVCVRQGHYIAASYHPELTQSVWLHERFIEMMESEQLWNRSTNI